MRRETQFVFNNNWWSWIRFFEYLKITITLIILISSEMVSDGLSLFLDQFPINIGYNIGLSISKTLVIMVQKLIVGQLLRDYKDDSKNNFVVEFFTHSYHPLITKSFNLWGSFCGTNESRPIEINSNEIAINYRRPITEEIHHRVAATRVRNYTTKFTDKNYFGALTRVTNYQKT